VVGPEPVDRDQEEQRGLHRLLRDRHAGQNRRDQERPQLADLAEPVGIGEHSI
jgi:hypothetical protein